MDRKERLMRPNIRGRGAFLSFHRRSSKDVVPWPERETWPRTAPWGLEQLTEGTWRRLGYAETREQADRWARDRKGEQRAVRRDGAVEWAWTDGRRRAA